MEGFILEDDEAEEDPAWSNQVSGRNCILFLVDFRKSMHNGNHGGSYFKQSMVCCRDAMIDIAKKQRGDMIGILLFGTKQCEGKYAPDNVAILQELAVPSIQMIKNLNKVLDGDCKELLEKYGNVEEVNFWKCVNYCQILIHMNKRKFHIRSIVLLTDDDNPCGDGDVEAFRARKQADELYEHGIELDLVAFGELFDSNLLFKELVLMSRGELLKDWEGKDPIMRINNVQNQIERITQKFTRRLSFLRIGDERGIFIMQVSLYKLFTEPRKVFKDVKQSNEEPDADETINEKRNREIPTIDDFADDIFAEKVVLDKIAEDERLAASKINEASTSDHADSGKALNSKVSEAVRSLDDSIVESQEEEEEEDKDLHPLIGGKFIDITKIELKNRTKASLFNIRRGFYLLGFVQTVEVPLYYNLGEPYLMLPNGRDKNNRIAFSHLLHKCLERKVSMIGWFCLTKPSSPTLCALHPTEASSDGKGHPKGFILSRIPFSDEIFDDVESESQIIHEATNAQLEAAKEIIAKLTLPYTVDLFTDYEYLSRVSMIEALALDYTDVPEVEDSTDLDLDAVSDRLGELSTEFYGDKEIDDPRDKSCQPSSQRASKRLMKSGSSESPTKQRKTFDVIEMIHNGQASKLTVAELRDVLKAEGVRSLSTFTKSKLVEIANRRFRNDSQ